MDFLIDSFAQAQAWLYESCFQPLLFALGFGGLLESAYEATGWLLVGVLQLLVMLLAFAPLQWWRPAQVISDRAAIRTDVLYTLIHRLGLFRVAMFFSLEPLLDEGVGTLRVWGMPTFQIDDLWPQLTATPWVSFVLYLVIFDFCNYWFHRAQHHFGWWWKLHALHHSQQQMTMWTDNRNHLLDDVLRDVLFVAVGVLIGIAPGQFVALVALMQLSETCSTPMFAFLLENWASACGSARVFTACTIVLASAMKARRRRPVVGQRYWAGTISASCCPGGTCFLVLLISVCATCLRACVTRWSRVSITAKAFGTSNGVACCA